MEEEGGEFKVVRGQLSQMYREIPANVRVSLPVVYSPVNLCLYLLTYCGRTQTFTHMMVISF